MQILIYRRQTSIMEGGLEATRKAADAAASTVNAIVGVKRAWLLIHKKTPYDTGYEWILTNHGKTPARLVAIQFTLIAYRTGELPPLEPPVNSTRLGHSRILGPKDDMTIYSFDIAQSFDDIWDDIMAGKEHIYFFVSVLYSDVFNEKLLHETREIHAFKPPKGFAIFEPSAYTKYT